MFADEIALLLKKNQSLFEPVVDFNPKTEKVISLDFTSNNASLKAEIFGDTLLFSNYVAALLSAENAKYGIGGYLEERNLYARSSHFNSAEGEARRLHLGVDIWGEANTAVYSFFDAKVHSYAFNDHFGDYGATIILEHELENTTFYSLYGHLSLANLDGLFVGKSIKKGQQFADFGIAEENGHWPPHLHLQLICNMDDYFGDYPGVAKIAEKELWASKIPDANLILNWD
jgi:murein DD-endopeptidase MepM/ murein hydrolase activator NlpD